MPTRRWLPPRLERILPPEYVQRTFAEDSVSLMAERVVRNHGVPDVIVNCAGQGSWRFLHEMQVCFGVHGSGFRV
jgi:hypothetical protein